MKHFFTLVLLFYTQFLFAQNEANIWYFGFGAGLDFNGGPPVPLTNGALSTDEGCSSICDANGNLLFYTDGMTIWNINHIAMPNGSGLTGNPTSTQSGLIVKQPGNPNLYYVFTTFTSLDYSIVDINLQGGLGDVVSTAKNIFVYTSAEKLSAVKHSNNIDVWIVIHESGTNGFNSFLLTATGLIPTAVHSNEGGADLSLVGQMKISPNGDKIAVGLNGLPETVTLADFDNATGVVSNGFGITTIAFNQTYGLEFSPDGTRLYTSGESGNNNVYQYDLTAGSPAAISASGIVVGVTAGPIPAGMQLGPDLKIYVTRYGSGYVDVINDPNVLGSGCNYVTDAVFLNGGTCQIGLPGFSASLFMDNIPPIALFTADHYLCPGTCTSFNNNSLYGDTYQWIFPGGSPSTSTDTTPSNICYNTPGHYAVTLIATNANGVDTLTLPNYITVYPYSPPQSILQNGDTLFSNPGFVTYQWFFNGDTIPGETNYFHIALLSGNYSVVCIDKNGCSVEAVVLNVIASIQSTIDNQQPIRIYPNPVIDKFTIHDSRFTIETARTISIFNVVGKTVFSAADCLLSSVDCRLFPTGIYWLELTNGPKIFRAKFIKL